MKILIDGERGREKGGLFEGRRKVLVKKRKQGLDIKDLPQVESMIPFSS